MKYVRFSNNGKEQYGIIENGGIYPVTGDIYADFSKTGERVEWDAVKILPPSVPTKIVAVGKNYFDHVQEFGGPVPETPIIFLKPTSAVIAHGEEIILPDSSARVDFECELCFIVKKKAKNIKASEANGYILGYTCFNDVTARDIQSADGQWTRAKGFDTFAPFGPVVTDEIDPGNVDIKTLLNGEIKQHSNTNMLMWNIPALFEFITSCMTLFPGDVVTTGTPAGVGSVKSGDVVEVVIENVGTLKNHVK